TVQDVLRNLQDLQDSARAFDKDLSGTLKLGCFQTLSPLLLPSLATHFASEHPNVHLSFLEGSPQQLEAELHRGHCEAIILYKEHITQELDCYPLRKHSIYLALHEDHPLAELDQVPLNKLIDEPYILLDQEPVSTHILKRLQENGITYSPRLTSRSIDTVRSFVARGLGFTIIGVRPHGDMSSEGRPIVFKELYEAFAPSEIVLCTLPGSIHSRRVEAAIESLQRLQEIGSASCRERQANGGV